MVIAGLETALRGFSRISLFKQGRGEGLLGAVGGGHEPEGVNGGGRFWGWVGGGKAEEGFPGGGRFAGGEDGFYQPGVARGVKGATDQAGSGGCGGLSDADHAGQEGLAVAVDAQDAAAVEEGDDQ